MIPVVTPYERVQTVLAHSQPDRAPVDFLATGEIWDKPIAHFQPDPAAVGGLDFFDARREAILRHLDVDCRLASYDISLAAAGLVRLFAAVRRLRRNYAARCVQRAHDY